MIEYALAVWRLSYLLVKEDGPDRLSRRLREHTGIEYDEHDQVYSYPDWNPLTCVYCTSLWVAMLLYFAPKWLIQILAASAVAVIVEKYHGDR